MNRAKTYSYCLLAMFLILQINSPTAAEPAPSSLELAKEACESFKVVLRSQAISYGYTAVPKTYGQESGETIPLFYWSRPGKDPSFPPLVFLHGGVGGDSHMLLDLPGTKRLIAEYPGDFFALDLRGEGCAKTLPSNLHPSAYEHLNVINVARDIEFLRRQNFFGAENIRLFGQSRGSMIIHHLFNMFPSNIESAHAHGLFAESPARAESASVTRAEGYLHAWRRYKAQYPGDEAIINKVKAVIKNDECWTGIDNMQICGPESVGVFGISLAREAGFESIHEAFAQMLDENGEPNIVRIRRVIGDRWQGTLYGEFNYILGANGQDFGSVGGPSVDVLEKSGSPIFHEAPMSEVRFVKYAIQKTYADENGQVLPLTEADLLNHYKLIDFASIRKSLNQNPDQFFFTYAGTHDPIGAPSTANYGRQQLSGCENYLFVELPGGDHGSFEHPTVIENLLKKSYRQK